MPEPSFGTASRHDVPALLALVQSAYRGDTSRAGWTTEADLLDGQRIDAAQLQTVMDAPDSSVLTVTDEDGELVGCANLALRADGDAYFGMFAIRPTAQGSGTGRQVLAEAERLARSRWQVPGMTRSVIAQRSELIAWYERRGYRRTGATEPFPYGDERFGRPLRDDLHFVVLRKEFES